jgi:GxxExxY protein
MKELIQIQSELKAPKNQHNSFGKYNYRSAEDILEALKPLLLKYECQLTVYDEIEMEVDLRVDLRVDLLVNETVIIELKAIENILPVHEAQLLTYMKLLKKPQGLLINFFTANISKSVKPFVNEYFKLLPD